MDVGFLSDQGILNDHFSLMKTPQGVTIPPGVPAALAAISAGNSTAILRWDDVDMEDLYIVEMSLNGTNYTGVGTTGVDRNSILLQNLSAGMPVWLRVRARNSNGFSASVAYNFTPSVAAVLTPLQQWRFSYFSATTDTGMAATLADPDGDGITNLMEYALGTNPCVGNAPLGLCYYFDLIYGAPYYGFDRLQRPEITYIIEVSQTMAGSSWYPIYSSSGAGNTPEFVRVEDPTLGSDDRQFARLRVTLP
jgi:hypothetical protein